MPRIGILRRNAWRNEPNLDLVFERMRFFEILEVGLAGSESLGFDVLAFDEQKAIHAFHVLRQACQCALDHGDDHGQACAGE